MLHVVVDGANVVGSRPDGWWRDRAGAARRLAEQLVALLVADTDRLAETLGRPAGHPLRLHLVLEGAAARAEDLPEHPAFAVVRARADGDSAIVELVRGLVRGSADEPGSQDWVVVTADRELRDRVAAAGAGTVGPGTLLRALPDR